MTSGAVSRSRSTAASSASRSCPSTSSPRQRGEEGHAFGRRLERRLPAQALQRRAPASAARCRRCPGARRARRRRAPAAGSGTPLLAHAERVEAPAAELERDAAALVEDVVGAHLVGVLAAQPLGAGSGPHLLVGGGDDRAARPRGRQPSRPSAAAAATSAATWSFMSCAPRPRTSPSTTSPAQGSKLHSEGSAGTVSAWPSRQSVGPAVVAAQPRDQVRAAGLGGQAARTRTPRRSGSRPAAPGPRSSLPGGLTVSIRISSCRAPPPGCRPRPRPRSQLAQPSPHPCAQVTRSWMSDPTRGSCLDNARNRMRFEASRAARTDLVAFVHHIDA